jgi:hypothetical protein
MPTLKGPSNNNTGLFYRKHVKEGTSHINLRLPNKIVDGIEAIKAAFNRTYPERNYPSLTLALQIAIERSLLEFEKNPAALEDAVRYFAGRYATPHQRSRY